MIGLYGQQKLFVPAGPLNVTYLLIGGGGGGSWSGGGAGGVLQGTTTLISGIYNITVGTGGTGAYNTIAQQGGNTIFNKLTAFGGGAGVVTGSGRDGGSGSGGAKRNDPQNPGGNPVTGQGNSGGSGGDDTNMDVGGGGGGASSAGVGGDSNSGTGGNGGAGITSTITGFSVDYAGGGGGTGNLFDTYGRAPWEGGGAAAFGGGSGGSDGFDPGKNGATDNTGGGGGGQRTGAGGNGGSGIIVISYPGTTPRATGGDYQYTMGGDYIHVFNQSNTNATYNLNTNLLAFWNMDEAVSSGIRYDSSGNGNNLTDYYNNTGYTSGIISNAANFNSNSCLASSNIFNTYNNFSVSMWVYAKSYQGSGPHMIGSPFNSGWFGQILGTSYQFGFPGTAGSGLNKMLQDSLPDPLTNTFRHYVFTKQGNAMSLYRNGFLISNYTSSGAFGVNSSQVFYVGADAGSYGFNGVFDAVGVWSRALQPSEIYYLYNAGAGRQTPLTSSLPIDDTKLIVT